MSDPVRAHSLFPLFANLAGRPVLVVGAGDVAARKLSALLAAGARVQVVARGLGQKVQDWQRAGRLQWLAAEFEPSQLDGMWLVIVATNDASLNAEVAGAAEQRRIWANVVDDVQLSSYQSPAVVDRAPLQIAISSGGAAPVLARQMRERIEVLIDSRVGELASLLHRWRDRIRARLPSLSVRRRFLEGLSAGRVGRLIAAGAAEHAERALQTALAQADTAPVGFVSIVGAGPGDPDLLSIKALRRMQEADVILHDRLVSAQVLQLARRDAQLIETGKQSGHHHTTQQRIHELMLDYASQGLRVVRLKGGDPFIFGRGGEEIEFLREHQIDFEVVPGISAALACAAYSGIPLTHREHAHSVRLLTAHCQDTTTELDWQALAQERQTLAVYMGVAALPQLCAQLILHGRSPNTPFALIENGTLPQQRVVLGRLGELPARAEEFKVRSPALLILGEVAALGERLHWFGAAPLQSSELTVSPGLELASAA